jgi:hypothetical protein
MNDEDNGGGFPGASPSRSRYPRSKQEERGDRSKWPWLPGSIPRPWQDGRPLCLLRWE